MAPTPSPSASAPLLKPYPSSWTPAATLFGSPVPAATSTATAPPPLLLPFSSPAQSSSARILGYLNPKCGLIHNNYNVNSRCQDCAPNSNSCRQVCLPYLILYGSGSTGGIALVETLDLPGRKVSNFVVGCSLFSSHQPAGITGFGR